MRAECIDAVQKAIGRTINQAERQGIEQRVANAMRQEAQADPAAWRAKSKAQRLADAGKRAGDEIIHEARKKRQRVALQILAAKGMETRMADAKARGKQQAGAVFDVLEQVERDRKGIERDSFGDLTETLDSIGSRLLGLIEDPRTARAVVLEIFGQDSGSAIAKKAAQAWLRTVERLRTRFNAAGGDVGQLDYGYIPQPHDQARVLKAGADTWAAETMPLLDRSRYVHPDGTAYTDADMMDFLRASWETIATDGANKIQPGQSRGSSMLANRGSEHRQIHFRDGDAYMAYMSAYGRNGVLSSMQSHIGRLARDIALVENMGPNPAATFQVARDTIKKAGLSTRVQAGTIDIESAFGTVTGKYNHPASATMASVFQGARNLQVASKLGGAVLSSVTDLGTLAVTAGFHRLPAWNVAANLVRSFGDDAARFANRAGLMADSIISDMNRWAEGNIGPGFTAKLSNATMKLSLMNAWTDATRRAFGLSMMGAMGRMTRQGWASLDDATRARMERAGIDANTWAIFEQATPENWRGDQMLTKQSIEALPISDREKQRAITRLLGFIQDESEYAVVNPDLTTRTIQQGASQKGTAVGELWRSAMLFKSFPIAMISRHWDRMLNDETMRGGQRLAYGATMMVSLMALGYVAMSLKDLAKGKDPRRLDDPRSWGAAFMQGGGAGIMGDFLFGDVNRFGNSLTATLAGPLASTAEDLAKLTIGNIQEVARGKDTKAAAEALRFIKANAPLANLWYSSAAIERAFLHDLQEMASPGYLKRMERRAMKDNGQSYWWQPGKLIPARAPSY